jgi:hypothetical protein
MFKDTNKKTKSQNKHTKIDFGNQIEASLQRTCLQKMKHKLSLKAKITCPICKLKHNENTKTSQSRTWKNYL